MTEQAWADQVERADRAEQTRDNMLTAIRLVLREHDSCICRHTRRILWGQVGLSAMDTAHAAFGADVSVTETVTGYQKEES